MKIAKKLKALIDELGSSFDENDDVLISIHFKPSQLTLVTSYINISPEGANMVLRSMVDREALPRDNQFVRKWNYFQNN
jgi:hypothetical protein